MTPLDVPALRAFDRDPVSPASSASVSVGTVVNLPPVQDKGQSHWFTDQVYPHEPALRNFLRRRFSTIQEIDDLIQEAYARLLQARARGNVTNVKSFLFSTARNAAVDWCRRRQRRPNYSLADLTALSDLKDEADTTEDLCRTQELQLLQQAIASLPDRCRTILTLRKIEQLSRDEIARRLNISEATVNAQIQIGMIECQRFFMQHGLLPKSP